jgi:hypothetical protein
LSRVLEDLPPNRLCCWEGLRKRVVRCPDKKKNSSDLDLVTGGSILYALPTFLVLLHSAISCHLTHLSLELYYAETAKLVLQLEAHLQATSVKQFPENYDIFERSACHEACWSPRQCSRKTTTETLTLKGLRSTVAFKVMFMPYSGMAVMEAESTLTRKTLFVLAQNIV